MGELSSSSHKSEGEASAKIYEVDFIGASKSDEYIEPDDVTDAEALDLFFSQLSHPGANRSSEELGEYIQRILGNPEEAEQSKENIAWRARMDALQVSVDDLDSTEYDTLVDSDAVFRDIIDTLSSSKEHTKDLHEARKALRLLLNLRAGVIALGEVDPELNVVWHNLIARLAKP